MRKRAVYAIMAQATDRLANINQDNKALFIPITVMFFHASIPTRSSRRQSFRAQTDICPRTRPHDTAENRALRKYAT